MLWCVLYSAVSSLVFVFHLFIIPVAMFIFIRVAVFVFVFISISVVVFIFIFVSYSYSLRPNRPVIRIALPLEERSGTSAHGRPAATRDFLDRASLLLRHGRPHAH